MSQSPDPARSADIHFKVKLNEKQLPVEIEWSATDAPDEGPQPTRSIMLSVWNDEHKRAMRVDLWTEDMLVDDMKLFMIQTLLTMADTLERATSEKDAARELRAFGQQFASRLGFSALT